MKKQIILFLLLGASAAAPAQHTVTVTVANPLASPRTDEPVSLAIDEAKMYRRVVVSDEQGRVVPSQIDDLDENAYNDEVFFLADLKGKEKKTYRVALYTDGQQEEFPARTYAQLTLPSKNKKLAKNQQDIYLRAIAFDKKTKDRYHYVHSHGVCFESDLVAMRVYFDNRQTIDLYGKTHKGLVLFDTQFYPTDEQLRAGSGDDVLWVGNTYGLGALRGWDGTRQLLFDDMKFQEQRVITEGPLRAIVETEMRGWVPAPGLKPITAVIRYTIYGGHRDFDVDVRFDRDVSLYRFATGVINVKGSTEFSDHKGLRGCYGTDWPTGKDDGKHKLETVGLAICVPPDYLDGERPATADDYTFVVRPRGRDLHYRLAYTSADEDFGFGGAADWFKWMKEWKKLCAHPISITVGG